MVTVAEIVSNIRETLIWIEVLFPHTSQKWIMDSLHTHIWHFNFYGSWSCELQKYHLKHTMACFKHVLSGTSTYNILHIAYGSNTLAITSHKFLDNKMNYMYYLAIINWRLLFCLNMKPSTNLGSYVDTLKK